MVREAVSWREVRRVTGVGKEKRTLPTHLSVRVIPILLQPSLGLRRRLRLAKRLLPFLRKRIISLGHLVVQSLGSILAVRSSGRLGLVLGRFSSSEFGFESLEIESGPASEAGNQLVRYASLDEDKLTSSLPANRNTRQLPLLPPSHRLKRNAPSSSSSSNPKTRPHPPPRPPSQRQQPPQRARSPSDQPS